MAGAQQPGRIPRCWRWQAATLGFAENKRADGRGGGRDGPDLVQPGASQSAHRGGGARRAGRAPTAPVQASAPAPAPPTRPHNHALQNRTTGAPRSAQEGSRARWWRRRPACRRRRGRQSAWTSRPRRALRRAPAGRSPGWRTPSDRSIASASPFFGEALPRRQDSARARRRRRRWQPGTTTARRCGTGVSPRGQRKSRRALRAVRRSAGAALPRRRRRWGRRRHATPGLSGGGKSGPRAQLGGRRRAGRHAPRPSRTSAQRCTSSKKPSRKRASSSATSLTATRRVAPSQPPARVWAAARCAMGQRQARLRRPSEALRPP